MQYSLFVQSVSRNIICTAWYPFIMRAAPSMFPISCASFDLSFGSNVNLISFIIMCTRLSLFGSTYITLMAQNSKTIWIIFLPKCTQKNCAFYAAFYMFFLRISVLSSKTKSALAAVFCGYFYINRPWWLSPPCLILRKFARRGPLVFIKKWWRDLDTPTYNYIL